MLFLERHNGRITSLVMYVDDIMATGNNSIELAALWKYLSTKLVLKDFRALKFFLGIEVPRSKLRIFLSHRKYVQFLLNLLGDTSMTASKPVGTPFGRGNEPRDGSKSSTD